MVSKKVCPQTMKSLDLFTGIGGIALAFRDLGIEPAAYCERDPMAISVLRQRMRCGHLPPAPLHTDVERFPGKDYTGKIDVLCAGFPCTGFSAMKMNTKDAFNNPGSGLYRHVCRLIDEIQPPIVFLENVQGIRLEGLRFVAETLRSRGYDASWVSLRGFNVGAPQHRPRWFCLATKTKFKGATLTLKKPFVPYNWKKEPVGCPRLIFDKTLIHERSSLLGNTVIPDMVRWSFLYLWTGSRLPYDKVFGSTSWVFTKPDPKKAKAMPEENPPATGMILGQNRLGSLPVPSGLLQLPASRGRTLDPKKFTFEGPKNPINVLPSHVTPIHITTWATPRYSSTGCSRVLTTRTERDLPTQLRFATDTPEKQRAGQPNPDFLEWLLGLPRGWTNPNSRDVLH
jgi:hypothetical protein